MPSHPTFLSEITSGRSGRVRDEALACLKRNMRAGLVVALGDADRPLYAPAREYGGVLGELGSWAIRCLQTLPLSGAVRIKELRARAHALAAAVPELKSRRLVFTMGGHNGLVGLNANGARCAAPLGDALRTAPLTDAEVEASARSATKVLVRLLSGPASSGELRKVAVANPHDLKDLGLVDGWTDRWRITMAGRCEAAILAKARGVDPWQWHDGEIAEERRGWIREDHWIAHHSERIDRIGGLSGPLTYEQIAEALGATRERVRQLLMDDLLPVARIYAPLDPQRGDMRRHYVPAGHDVVDPGCLHGHEECRSLARMPAGWFTPEAIGVDRAEAETFRRKGILEARHSLGRHIYRLTALGRWASSCLGLEPAPESANHVSVPRASRNEREHQFLTALAASLGDLPLTAYLVNIAAGNEGLDTRLEVILTNLVKQGILARSREGGGRSWRYRLTDLGREWNDHWGLTTINGRELAMCLGARSRIAKNTGLPPDVPRVTLMLPDGREVTPAEHLRRKPARRTKARRAR